MMQNIICLMPLASPKKNTSELYTYMLPPSYLFNATAKPFCKSVFLVILSLSWMQLLWRAFLGKGLSSFRECATFGLSITKNSSQAWKITSTLRPVWLHMWILKIIPDFYYDNDWLWIHYTNIGICGQIYEWIFSGYILILDLNLCWSQFLKKTFGNVCSWHKEWGTISELNCSPRLLRTTHIGQRLNQRKKNRFSAELCYAICPLRSCSSCFSVSQEETSKTDIKIWRNKLSFSLSFHTSSPFHSFVPPSLPLSVLPSLPPFLPLLPPLFPHFRPLFLFHSYTAITAATGKAAQTHPR